MKKSKQSTKPTTTAKTKNIEPWIHFDDYVNIIDGKRHPISEQGLDRLGKDLLQWSQNDNVLVLEDFFRSHGIPEMTYRDWKKKNTLFRLRYETAKGYIGSRREQGAIKRAYSERMILNSMPKFDASWSELEEWRSGLKTKENAMSKQNITVVMDKFPSIDDKKVNDDGEVSVEEGGETV